jgi:hypothetical protein
MKQEWIAYVQIPTERLGEQKEIVSQLETILGSAFVGGTAYAAQGGMTMGTLPLKPHLSEYGIGYMFRITDFIGEGRRSFPQEESDVLYKKLKTVTDQKIIGMSIYSITATDVSYDYRIIR